ncbi:MAG: AAA family ATPase [Syntrophobacteraceae bacterium]|nr:AAA family ATPase [Syntrophobacteraceae bacterium]
MYREFFKLKKSPFHITPDPDFLFLSPSHKEASGSIFYGIERRKGFIAVTGEVGVGKTTILRSYLEGIDSEKIRIIYIFNAALSFNKLLKQICSELGVRMVGEDPEELIVTLFHYLIEEYKKDRNVVLIIDEAQNMSVETLERLRMLSNLETSQDKLIQIILVGQPEFEAKLELPELRQLKQRIAIRSRIESLTAEESLAYIHHRLMRASSFHNPVFTGRALKLIIEHGHGIPRTMNILCDNALVTAYGYQRKPVDHRIVQEVLEDFRAGQTRNGFAWTIFWLLVLAGGLGAAFLVSMSVTSSRLNPAGGRQSPGASLGRPLPQPVQEVITKSAKTKANAPGAKKEEPVARVEHGVAVGGKPKSTVGADGVKPPAATRDEVTKRRAEAGVKPAVITSSTGQAGPAAQTAGASGGNGPASKKASRMSVGPPVQAPANPSEADSRHPVVVKEGDSVSKLLMGIHGSVSPDMLESFKELNPRVEDINRISVGEQILLP